jgi:hypothetical protein
MEEFQDIIKPLNFKDNLPTEGYRLFSPYFVFPLQP